MVVVFALGIWSAGCILWHYFNGFLVRGDLIEFGRWWRTVSRGKAHLRRLTWARCDSLGRSCRMGRISAIMSYNEGADHLENNNELAEIHEVNNQNHVTWRFKTSKFSTRGTRSRRDHKIHAAIDPLWWSVISNSRSYPHLPWDFRVWDLHRINDSSGGNPQPDSESSALRIELTLVVH